MLDAEIPNCQKFAMREDWKKKKDEFYFKNKRVEKEK